MKELNELVELAKEFDASTTVEAAMTIKSKFKATVTCETILTIAEAFRDMEQRAESAEDALEVEKDIHDDTVQAMQLWCERAKAAEAKLAELEKQNPKLEYIRRLETELAQLRARPAPSVSLAELVPSIEALRAEFEEAERQSDDGFNLHRYDTVYADDETQERWDLWLSCHAAILRNIEEAK